MMDQQRLALSSPAVTQPEKSGFDFSKMRAFREIPAGRDIDVVSMHGLVFVFDRMLVGVENWEVGALYVRESQRPPSALSWADWIRFETCHTSYRSNLKTRREVVQYVQRNNGPALRMASGGVDGPYRADAFGLDLIGKVIGIYLPGGAQ